MGEIGCGKIFLIRFFLKICQIDFYVLSIYVGVIEEMIINRVSVSDSKVKLNFMRCIWLFFDEINICDYLGFICDVICYYNCKGK